MISFTLYCMILLGMHYQVANASSKYKPVDKFMDEEYPELLLGAPEAAVGFSAVIIFILYRFLSNRSPPAINTPIVGANVPVGNNTAWDDLSSSEMLQRLEGNGPFPQVIHENHGFYATLLCKAFDDENWTTIYNIGNDPRIQLDGEKSSIILMDKCGKDPEFSKFLLSWIELGSIRASSNLLQQSVKFANQQIFKSVYNKIPRISSNKAISIINCAWEGNQLEMIQMILKKYVKDVNIKVALLKSAINSKNYSQIFWYFDHIEFDRKEITKLRQLLAQAPLDVFLFIRNKTSAPMPDLRTIYSYALDYENFALTDQLSKEGFIPINLHLVNACKEGRLNVVKYLISKNVSPTDAALNYAIMSGNLELVKFMVQSLGAPTLFSLELSCFHGNMPIYNHILKYFDHKVSSSCLDAAAMGGNVELVRKLLGSDIIDPYTLEKMIMEEKVVELDEISWNQLNNLLTKDEKLKKKVRETPSAYHEIKKIYEGRKLKVVASEIEFTNRSTRLLTVIHT